MEVWWWSLVEESWLWWSEKGKLAPSNAFEWRALATLNISNQRR
jgi:hypothetical protein